MNVYISVVSHGHQCMIKNIHCLPDLAKKYKVVVKENSERYRSGFDVFCLENNIDYIDDKKNLGFGENNNLIFKYIQDKFNPKDNDLFIVLNPDVLITCEEIEKIISLHDQYHFKLAGINLFTDENFTIHDKGIRHYPVLSDFFKSFFLGKNDTVINRKEVNDIAYVDWLAGSFMIFEVSHYANLKGFDERYFMYCEDIDICYRSTKKNIKPLYLPMVKAVHYAQYNNRKIFSRHFFWHIKSILIFTIKKMIIK
ncbi:glycosyltransferase family 2 protein [Pectobacteriaceae bacterium CE70]|nr:glycosyltransferase family 2 protein [Pectobacteriaceae bacterium C52]WJV68261.1 glycosyltransferase family 2 protein [Pectobacteriaceae bacterium CE70]